MRCCWTPGSRVRRWNGPLRARSSFGPNSVAPSNRLLRGDHVLALCRVGQRQAALRLPGSVDSPAGRQRVFEHLKTRPYPHYEAAAKTPGLLVRIEADGKRTVGRFVNRQFQPVKTGAKKKAKPASGACRQVKKSPRESISRGSFPVWTSVRSLSPWPDRMARGKPLFTKRISKPAACDFSMRMSWPANWASMHIRRPRSPPN